MNANKYKYKRPSPLQYTALQYTKYQLMALDICFTYLLTYVLEQR